MSSSPPLFATNPAWADVTPIEQYEGPTLPLAPILYGNVYKDATDYLRAVVASSEKSPRVLELTEAVVRLNPSHYTAWQYRYETLLTLLSSLSPPDAASLVAREEDFMDDMAIRSLKSYQVWHHRRLLLLVSVKGGGSEGGGGKLTQPEIERVKRELEFISRSFEEDSKNYHTWSYRQWVLSRFFGGRSSDNQTKDNDDDEEYTESLATLWTQELLWTERMLEKDVRNNSAWHHRFFVVLARPGALSSAGGNGGKGGEEGEEEGGGEVGRREVRYTKQSIALAPNNASAWNYLRGVLDRLGVPYASVEGFVRGYVGDVGEGVSGGGKTDTKPNEDKEGDTEDNEDDVIDTENPRPAPGAELPCVAALEFLADVYERTGEREGVLRGVEIWKALANEYDTMRRRYWEHRIREGIESLGGGAKGGKGVKSA